jgi:hypothetical protein
MGTVIKLDDYRVFQKQQLPASVELGDNVVVIESLEALLALLTSISKGRNK